MEKLIHFPPELNNIIKKFYVGDNDLIYLFIHSLTDQIFFEKRRQSHQFLAEDPQELSRILKQTNNLSVCTANGEFYIKLGSDEITITDHPICYNKSYVVVASIDYKFRNISGHECGYPCQIDRLFKDIKSAFIKVQKFKIEVELLFS